MQLRKIFLSFTTLLIMLMSMQQPVLATKSIDKKSFIHRYHQKFRNCNKIKCIPRDVKICGNLEVKKNITAESANINNLTARTIDTNELLANEATINQLSVPGFLVTEPSGPTPPAPPGDCSCPEGLDSRPRISFQQNVVDAKNHVVRGDLCVQGDTTLCEADVQGDLEVEGGITAQSVEACLIRTPTAILGQTSSTLRDQFNPDQLLDLMSRVVNAYFNGPGELITLPVWSWTGFDPIPTRENLPKETFFISSNTMTGDQMTELVISLFGLLYYELEGDGHYTVFSTDILNTRVLPQGLQSYMQSARTIFEYLLARSDTPDLVLDETHKIALIIGIATARNMVLIYEDPNQLDSWPALVGDANHRFYNGVASDNAETYGLLTVGNLFLWNFAFLNFISPDEYGFTSENIETLPAGLMNDQQILKKVAQYETSALGRYFWVKWYTDPFNSQIYTFNGVDPDGYRRPLDWTLQNFLNAGVFVSWDFLEESTRPFKELKISGAGLQNALAYEDYPDEGTFGVRSLIELNAASPEIAQEIICESEQVWNKTIQPLYEKLNQLAAVRREEAQDDFYSGAWRAKIRSVKQVNRTSNDPNDLTATTVSFLTAFNNTQDVIVPFDPLLNQQYANDQAGGIGVDPSVLVAFFEELQSAVAEMDDWLDRELRVIFATDNGDQFNLLFKVNPNRGICGPPRTGTVPYTSIDDILANYAADQKTVGVDASLPELVFQSGFSVAQMLYDIREFIANQYVIENFAVFGFANAASAGLCKQNAEGHFVSYEEVKDYLVAQTNNGLSDIQVLGRQYGFEADGVTLVPSEQPVLGTLVYNFSNQFDYIYRQHYAVNPNAPLTPSNVIDPVTGKEYYQYTDPGDEARRAQFLIDFRALETLSLAQANAGKQGTYWRWKLDWMTQKMFSFVIQHAVELGILKQDFVDQYYSHTLIDTNGNECSGLVHSDPETIIVRALGQLSGSANAAQFIDFNNLTFTIRVRFTSLDPKNSPSLINELGTIIHEVALGHGFDSVPNAIDLLRGNPRPLSWMSNVNAIAGFQTEGFLYTYPNLGPGYNTLFEGWATYGELVGIQKGLYVNFDANGCPIFGDTNRLSEFIAQVALARVGGRQVVAVAENFSKWAWSVYKSATVFKDLTDLRVEDAPDFHVRFISTPLQQTSYAVGLVTNVGVLAIIREAAETHVPPCIVDQAAFNEFRITRTDYILGEPLQQIVDDNIDLFLDCPPMKAKNNKHKGAKKNKKRSVVIPYKS